MCMGVSCVYGSVVVLGWYLPGTFFRSDVSGAGVSMYALCLFDGGVCGAGVNNKYLIVASCWFFYLHTSNINSL